MKANEIKYLSSHFLTKEENEFLDKLFGERKRIEIPFNESTKYFAYTPREKESAHLSLLLAGISGSGKTYSLRNLNQREVVIFDFDNKSELSYEYSEAALTNPTENALVYPINLQAATTTSSNKPTLSGLIATEGLAKSLVYQYLLIKNTDPRRRYFIFDTFNSLMNDREGNIQSTTGQKGVDARKKYWDLASEIQNTIRTLKVISFREDVLIFIMHSERTETGRLKLKLTGKKLEKVTIEAELNHFLLAERNYISGQYEIKTSGEDLLKSREYVPEVLPSDLQLFVDLMEQPNIRTKEQAEAFVKDYDGALWKKALKPAA